MLFYFLVNIQTIYGLQQQPPAAQPQQMIPPGAPANMPVTVKKQPLVSYMYTKQ
jgi:hypothetical protein